ncbi:hypothetical protein V8C43DRAFT_33597 [Trichoderma afarasin]
MAAVGCFPPAGRGRGQSGNGPWKWTWKWSRPDMLRQDCHAAAAPSTSSIHTMPCHAMPCHARPCEANHKHPNPASTDLVTMIPHPQLDDSSCHQQPSLA